VTYGTCSICGEPHRLTQPTGASPPPAVIVEHGSTAHPDWYEHCPGSGERAPHADSPILAVDISGATVAATGGVGSVLVSWEELRRAAGQEDDFLAAKYSAILSAARKRAAEIKDSYGCSITGVWYEWIDDDDREPCAALVADGLDRPRIPSHARLTRQADPDEVAAAMRRWRTNEDIRIYGAGLEPLPRPTEWWWS
jgi:hypothetical protein